VLQVRREFERPGGAANVACNLADLGQPVTLATILGNDDAGDRLAAMMALRRVLVVDVRDAGLATTQKIRSVCKRQQLLRVDFESLPSAASTRSLTTSVALLLARHRLVLLSDYAKGSLADAAQLIGLARERGCRVLVDPKGVDYERYRGAYLVKPNAAEFAAVVGGWADDADFRARAQALRATFGFEHLLVTRGELGMTLCSGGAHCIEIAADAREVYDVSGAGDTVLAVLAHALARGMALDAAARLANRAAGVVVGKFGTATVGAAELAAAARPPRRGGAPADRRRVAARR
jgi:rfaE bifunctional protein kinase chain/domain